MRDVPNVRVQPALFRGLLLFAVVVRVRSVAARKKAVVPETRHKRVGQVVKRLFDLVVPKFLRLLPPCVAVVVIGRRVRQLRRGLFRLVGP